MNNSKRYIDKFEVGKLYRSLVKPHESVYVVELLDRQSITLMTTMRALTYQGHLWTVSLHIHSWEEISE